MKNLMRKSRGFTLVELLIVMIIIGILAGGMMMVMGSSTDKADATKAISDLRTMASATLQYYADARGAAAPTLADLSQYMNKTLGGSYDVVAYTTTSLDQTWVGVQVPTAGARAKFAATVAQESLDIRGDTVKLTNTTIGAAGVFVDTDVWAYMRAK